jgi:methylated-DNA-protein-cysteine methyltransferase-like protein
MINEADNRIYKRIYCLVQQIPPGYVTTYGRIGQLLGCTARTVGFAMAALPPGSDVPWQRVINSQGKVSPRSDGEGNILQYDLLLTEGLPFDKNQRIDLAKHGWEFPGR